MAPLSRCVSQTAQMAVHSMYDLDEDSESTLSVLRGGEGSRNLLLV